MVKMTLKALRINKRETQEQTARNIGISTETWANYENGKTYPDVPIIQKIENYFQITYSEIDFLYPKNTV